MRINRFVAMASGMSRRAADTAVADGRITVNGALAGMGWIVGDDDKVALDGAIISLPAAHTYLMFNKPVGYVTSRAQQGSAPTIYEILPAKYHNLRAAGRLDRDSCGLLILSDDGDYVYLLTHPSQHKLKTYRLRLARALTADDIARLKRGVELEDGLSRIDVVDVDGRWVTVQLGEGRNRQVRRTLGAIGAGVITLQRVAMGGLRLGDLPEGQWREISADEIFGEAAGGGEAAIAGASEAAKAVSVPAKPGSAADKSAKPGSAADKAAKSASAAPAEAAQ